MVIFIICIKVAYITASYHNVKYAIVEYIQYYSTIIYQNNKYKQNTIPRLILNYLVFPLHNYCKKYVMFGGQHMLPEKSNHIWSQLVTGKKSYKCRVVPASMLLARIIRSTQIDDSPENVQRCIEETYTFFQRYQSILKDDIRTIFEQ